MGFEDFSVNYDQEAGRYSVFINDYLISENRLPVFVSHLDYLVKVIAQKNDGKTVVVDVNNYRRKREDLILELARAAARKAMAEKKEIRLPAMNAYERRLIHLELVNRPDIKTESEGEGRERYVIIRPIIDESGF